MAAQSFCVGKVNIRELFVVFINVEKSRARKGEEADVEIGLFEMSKFSLIIEER